VPINTFITRIGDNFVASLQGRTKLVYNVFPDAPPACDLRILIAVKVPSGPVHVATADTASESHLVALRSWVLSDDPDRVFPVEVALEKSVGALHIDEW
jgi:hypothetical protein